jgi:type 1 glutamine amidotransferase
MPSLEAQSALREWLEAGGRWLALHGTNCLLEMLDDGRWDAPRSAPLMMELLGSQFLSHPPIAPYLVTVADPAHALTRGIEPFETTDELYHMELHGDLQVLLEAECTEAAPHFAEGMEAPGTHPVMYIKNRGKGAVLYNTLGHCRGHYDMQPMLEWWPSVDRCAWDLPVFHDLLEHGLRWASEG